MPAEEVRADERVEDEFDYRENHTAVLYIVHVSNSMLRSIEMKKPSASDRPTVKTSAVRAALTYIFQVALEQTITSPDDMIGVYLVGAEECSNTPLTENIQENISEVMPLDQPYDGSLVNFRNFLKDEEEFQSRCRPNPATAESGDLRLSEVFFFANKAFKENAPNMSRRLVLITDNDNPCPETLLQAKQRALDLVQLDVVIHPILIQHDDRIFDVQKFYQEIPLMPKYLDSSEVSPIDAWPVTALTAFERLKIPHTRKRPECSINLTIGHENKIEIGSKVYLLIKRREIAKSCFVTTEGEVPSILKAVSSLLDDNGAQVKGEEMVRQVGLGADVDQTNIEFTSEEIKRLRFLGEDVMGRRMLNVIGFKPRSTLHAYLVKGTTRFLFPSDEKLKGSTRAFTSLYTSMLSKDVIGIVWGILKTSYAPRFFALVPAEEEVDENGIQLVPGGLFLVPLAFADEYRPIPNAIDENLHGANTDPARLETIQTLAHKLCPEAEDVGADRQPQLILKDYMQPHQQPNFRMHEFYQRILELTLGPTNFAETGNSLAKDTFKPAYKGIKKRFGEAIKNFNEYLNESWLKRALSSEPSDDSAPKRAKTTESRKPIEGFHLESLVLQKFKDKQANKLTVKELRSFAEMKNIYMAKDMKKAECISQVEKYLENQG